MRDLRPMLQDVKIYGEKVQSREICKGLSTVVQ